jgi:hypothetical protein
VTDPTLRAVTKAFVATAVCCTIASCSAGGGSNATTDGSTLATPNSPGPATSKALDACALVSTDDVNSLLGVSVAGRSTTTDPDMPGCIWENTTSEESVSVEIGNQGTAVNNVLPPPEPGFPDPTTPGPDGMRFLGPGSVEFAAGGRSNTVQVAVLRLLSGDQANSAAVDLAKKIQAANIWT